MAYGYSEQTELDRTVLYDYRPERALAYAMECTCT